MTREIEIEAKNLLTKDELHRLQRYFSIKDNQFVSQTNHYFETNDFALKGKKSALRIREKNGQYVMTLKQPNEVGLMETNQSVSKEEADRMIETGKLPEGEVKEDIIALNVPLDPFTCLGSLTTSRAEVSYKNQLVVLDISQYFDMMDYELEIEGTSIEAVNSLFERLLQQHDIPKRPTKNKIIRFFERKQELQSF
ncbi:CYTH domain-containing protein [Alkalihalobacterium chitinilyticum]|uniref:CYTH domain-containing protein n=1 Tax=Alkalihalobacterium chitinilyticum TaxID=2980103 RepID=A0ABT5VDT7_9BACI|nr:CYTH domain-containing protein [Alkalihalobacterium chitinilyticum]MDE5412648.1 CYTH domain-containing protein [Alkalihalobacterium chitinilyticum]